MENHNHAFGSINFVNNTRKCLLCKEIVPAESTYTVERIEGSLERYPGQLFAQWEGAKIREYLKLKEGDLSGMQMGV